MCGVGGKADRRPIDPPPIIQLRVVDPAAAPRPRRRPDPDPEASDDDGDDGGDEDRFVSSISEVHRSLDLQGGP